MIWQADPDGSPQKRGRHQDQPLTLAMPKEVLAQERHADREHLAQSLEQVQGDVRAMRGRVDCVETGFQPTDNYDAQAKTLEELKEAHREFEQRLKSVETRPASSTPGSTADTDAGGRQPALIVGLESRPSSGTNPPGRQGHSPPPGHTLERGRPLCTWPASGVCDPRVLWSWRLLAGGGVSSLLCGRPRVAAARTRGLSGGCVSCSASVLWFWGALPRCRLLLWWLSHSVACGLLLWCLGAVPRCRRSSVTAPLGALPCYCLWWLLWWFVSARVSLLLWCLGALTRSCWLWLFARLLKALLRCCLWWL